MKLSIIIPVYNEENNVDKLYNEISKLFSFQYEIIFINDGSYDNTYNKLEKLYKKDNKHIRVINFSRNYGKDAAIYAGLKYSKGEYSVIIDGDMQQSPKYLIDMVNYLDKNESCDSVAMCANNRKNEFFLKSFFIKLFYLLINIISDTKYKRDAGDFRMFRSNVKNAILSINEKNRFTKGIFNSIGFNTYYMSYDIEKRYSGKSKFNIIKCFKYAFRGIINYSNKPILFGCYIGLILIILGLFNVKINNLIIFGILFIYLYIIGSYVYNIFIEVKNRPMFIIKNMLGLKDEEK